MTEKKTSALVRRRSLVAFKSPVLWRGEGRSHLGAASGGEDMGAMMGKKEHLQRQREGINGKGPEGEENG